MTVVELHPEALLDKVERGELTQSERGRLDAHLRDCSVCRVELAMRGDFCEERSAGPEAPFSAEMLAAALGSVRASSPPRAPARRTRAWAYAAAAICTLGTGAAAHRAHLFTSTMRALEPSVQVVPPLRTKSVSAVPALPPSSDPPPPFTASAPPAPAAASAAHLAPRETAASLFDEVVSARRLRDYDRSIAACRALQARHGGSYEAQVSRGTLGRLLLDRGDAEGALASFADYQRNGGGDLEEVVLAGRAIAYARLGRDPQEKQAWLALLAAFPRTPYADQARARTGETRP